MKYLLIALLFTSGIALAQCPFGSIDGYPVSDGFEFPAPLFYPSPSSRWSTIDASTATFTDAPPNAVTLTDYSYIALGSPDVNDIDYLESFCFDASLVNQMGIRFHYYNNGPGFQQVRLEVSENGGSTWSTVWTSNLKGGSWFQVYADLTPYIGPSNLKLRFASVAGSQPNGVLALDAIRVEANIISPPSFCPGNTSIFSTFDGNLGEWAQSPSDDRNWSLRSGSTPSANTGPSSAAQGSQYIYFETSSPVQTGDEAILYGPCRNLTGNWDVKFRYHMYGAAMGTMRLQARVNGAFWFNLWSRTGDQGNAWRQVTVPLSYPNGAKVEFRLVGIRGSSFTSDMAFDDFNVTFTGFGGGGGGGGFGDPKRLADSPDKQTTLAPTLSVAPNPFRDQLMIQTTLPNVQGYRLTNLQGMVVQEGDLQRNDISVQNLPAGIYFMTVYNTEEQLVQKVVKQ